MTTEPPTQIVPLPLSVPLAERETGFSFMSRLAARNGVSSRLLGLDYDMPFKSVVDGEITAIRTLSALGSVNPEQVAKWTASHRNRSSHRLCGETFHGMSVRNPVIRGCPLCLKEDAQDHTRPPEQTMALRGHWMVKRVFLCVKHRHPLVPLWRESNLILRYDTSQRFTDHAAALVQGDFDQETREFTDYDQWIDNRLENGRADGWLDQHPLHAGATFCFLLGYALLRLEISAPSSIPREDRWAIYQTGYEVARKGESAIRKSLQKLQQRTATPQQGPKATFPLLYERLAHDYATDPDFMPFRDILRSHILETWPLGVGDELMGDPVERRQLHSVITASKETGVDQRRLRKLLEARKLISPEQPDAWALFDAEATSHLLASLVIYLPAKTFVERLCMTRSQFNLLVEDGVLRPTLLDVDTKHVWNPKDGQVFLAKLFHGAEHLVQAQHGWEHISKSAMRLKIRPGDIVRAIQANQPLRVGNHADFDGYAALYVYHDQIASLLGGKNPDASSIEMFAKSVGARQMPAFRRLIIRGHSPCTKLRNPRTNSMQLYISPTDAQAFHTKFYTLRSMSAEYDRSWQRLNAELAEAGVKPFSPDGVDYCKIYLKEDVDSSLG